MTGVPGKCTNKGCNTPWVSFGGVVEDQMSNSKISHDFFSDGLILLQIVSLDAIFEFTSS